MSQPPKSTMRAPSARWLSLRMVLRVMAPALRRIAPIIPDPRPPSPRGRASDAATPLRRAAGAAGAAVGAVAGAAFHLQGGVADAEALLQHARGHVPQRARVHAVVDNQ